MPYDMARTGFYGFNFVMAHFLLKPCGVRTPSPLVVAPISLPRLLPLAAAGPWFNGGNWNNGVPDASTIATIANGGTAQIDTGAAAAASLLNLGTSTGNATLAPSVGATGTLTLSGGQLAPGNSIGTLHADTLTWDGGGQMLFELGSAGASDQLALAGNFLKGSSGGAYAFTFFNAGWQVGQTYDLVAFSAFSFAPDDFSFTNTGGFDGDFTLGGGKLQFTLTDVPEPLLAIFPLVLALRCHIQRNPNS